MVAVAMWSTILREVVRGREPTLPAGRNGYHLLVDSVPAWVCGQCGEAYFDEREVDAIQRAIRSLDDHTRMLVIPA